MKKSALIIAVFLVALALFARLIPGPRTIDDSFITFRYARNVISGEGFVYNSGERVMGTTTPLFTLLMAGLAEVSGGPAANFPVNAWLVNCLADALTCLLLWQLGLLLGSERVGVIAGVLWAVAPFSVTFAIGGLETSVYVLLLTATSYFYIRRRFGWTAFVAALALLTRVDALILLGPLGLDMVVCGLRAREDRPGLGAVMAFLIPVTAWYGFAFVYFGSIFPHSISAKMAAYSMEQGTALIRLIQHYATPFLEYNSLKAYGIGLGLVLYPFLYILGARRAWKTESRSLAWLLYPWMYFIAFAILNPLIFRWYLTPPLPAYFLVILLGADQLVTRILVPKKVVIVHSLAEQPVDVVSSLRNEAVRANERNWRYWLTVAILLGLPLASTMTEWHVHPDHGPDRPAPDMAYIQLELLYRQAANQLTPDLTNQSVLAAGDVGVLGFYTPAKILDTVGLNSPVTLNYYPLDSSFYVGNYAVAPRLILDQKPDALVILEVYGRNGLLKDVEFKEKYHLKETIPTDMYGSSGMLLFEKNP